MKPTSFSSRGLIAKMLQAIALLTCLASSSSRAQAGASLMVYDFNLGGDPASNVDHVSSLGYSGLVTRCNKPSDLVKLASYASHVATLEDFQMLAYVSYDFQNPDSPQVWRDALPILASTRAPLWVIVKNAPSPLAVTDLLLRMAESSQSFGVPAVVYPHWNTDIENAAEAAAYIAQVGHPNLSNSLHSCHEIRSGNQNDLGAPVAAHAHASKLVTIAGADENAFAGPHPAGGVPWDDAIKPLDRGRFSLLPFLQALEDAGYDGPVILHTFGITNDADHLQRSIQAYAKYRSNVH